MKEMFVGLVSEAIKVLSLYSAKDQLSREVIVAYATVVAFVQHWPSLANAELKKLAESFSWIRDQENDRFLKQRRIAISNLAQSIRTSFTSC